MAKKLSKHDLFFAKGMEDPEKARALFKSYFPKDIQEYIDLETVTLEHLNSKFVDDGLESYTMCDALYQATSKDGIVLLLMHAEHYSYSIELAPIRANHYAISGILEYKKKHPNDPIPPILSLIYYQGKKPFKHSLDPLDLFKNVPEKIKNLIFKPILIDLNKYSDEELATHGASAAFELIMKHVFDKSTRENIERIGKAFNQTDGLFRDSALEYILSSSDFETDVFNDVFSKYIDVEKLMTIEKRLKQEGRQEGRQEEKLDVARRSLAKGLDIRFVSEIAGVDLVTVKKIKATMI